MSLESFGQSLCESFNCKLRDELLNGEIFYTLSACTISVYMLLAGIIAVAMEFVPHGSFLGIAGLFLRGFFRLSPASSFWTLSPDIFGRRLSGTATGALNFISYARAGLGEPLTGRFMDYTANTAISFPIVAVLLIRSALSALLIRR
jgi:OPA family glycerol-3-phosphate transporter-like MFS transporter/OPA family sugar phosphate sensor protein UhpC-like MFS transporter